MITYYCCLSFSVVSPGIPRQYELLTPMPLDRGVRDARLQNIDKVLIYLLNNVTTDKMIYYEGDFVETYPR